MIIEYLRYTIDADRQDDFISAYKQAALPLMAAEQSLSFDMAQCIEDPSQFILRIEWTSAEDHMQGFRGSDRFREFFAHIKPYLQDIQEMRHYNGLISEKK